MDYVRELEYDAVGAKKGSPDAFDALISKNANFEKMMKVDKFLSSLNTTLSDESKNGHLKNGDEVIIKIIENENNDKSLGYKLSAKEIKYNVK